MFSSALSKDSKLKSRELARKSNHLHESILCLDHRSTRLNGQNFIILGGRAGTYVVVTVVFFLVIQWYSEAYPITPLMGDLFVKIRLNGISKEPISFLLAKEFKESLCGNRRKASSHQC